MGCKHLLHIEGDRLSLSPETKLLKFELSLLLSSPCSTDAPCNQVHIPHLLAKTTKTDSQVEHQSSV